MEIAFLEKSHRQLCENERIAERKLGIQAANKLKRRLADLSAALSVKDIVVGNPREAVGNWHHIEIDLCDGFSIIFCANHNAIPVLESDAIDWGQVSRIKILRIESHYG